MPIHDPCDNSLVSRLACSVHDAFSDEQIPAWSLPERFAGESDMLNQGPSKTNSLSLISWGILRKRAFGRLDLILN